MGDRGNIVIRQSDGDVWFYTHWSGSEIKDTVKTALAKRWRWNDESYLARIVFSELVKGNEEEETGFGISTQLQDNGHDIVVVDVPHQRVFTIKEEELQDRYVPKDWKPKKSTSFENFVK